VSVMETKKKKGIGMMIAGGVLLVVAGVVVMQGSGGEEPAVMGTSTATTTASTTEDIFAMEPLVPEAKVSTEGWKTCRNEEYGYEFQFPAEWHIYGEDARSEPDAMGKTYFMRESEECNGIGLLLSSMSIGDYHNGNVTQVMNVYVERQPGKSIEWQAYGGKGRRIAVTGINGVLVVGDHVRAWGGRTWSARLEADAGSFWIYGDMYDSQSKVIETILSTLRFFDTGSTTAHITQQ